MPMAHFEATTQAKYWLFTSGQVEEMRKNNNQEASKRLKERIDNEEIEPLTLEEEAKLRRIYEIGIQKNAEKLGLPEAAQATAVTLFKRYFLRTSVMEADLSTIAITSLYLASKIEEYYIPFKEFAAVVETTLSVDQLLFFEMEIMQRLDFHISCYHPYLSFSALWFLLEKSWWNMEARNDLVDKKKLYSFARSLIHNSLLTDLMFFLSPGQIALGILSFAFSRFHISFPLDLCLTLESERNRENVAEEVDWLSLWEQSITELKQEISTCGGLYSWNIPTGEETKQLLKKLSLCIDPRVDPKSAEYLEMMKKREDDKEMKRLEKNRAFSERRKREFAMITGIGEDASQVSETKLEENVEHIRAEDLSKKTEEMEEIEQSTLLDKDDMKKKRRRE
ncbi:hypothetical protein GpartN1_g678.t1 [Galdieria partita]|uniref:Cyclin-like domain-containing protein n=1 Tax=Galdieria partita TaxID=83374 RepID=A0A9C7UMR7_9RHOD|nr:hypothetical protein GpartN1_g678.t1 [Galdieria partita]